MSHTGSIQLTPAVKHLWRAGFAVPITTAMKERSLYGNDPFRVSSAKHRVELCISFIKEAKAVSIYKRNASALP